MLSQVKKVLKELEGYGYRRLDDFLRERDALDSAADQLQGIVVLC
jgi:hypothetical protein